VNSSLVDELQEFVHDHRVHGALTADATEHVWNGYLLMVACPCGVVFERWVTPEDADADLVRITRLNCRASHCCEQVSGRLTVVDK
jgi:hypothetical protein